MDAELFNQLALKTDLENFATKEELRQMENRLMTRMDEMMVILKRMDEERVFTFEYVKRLEARVETRIDENTKDIATIKGILNIS